RSTRVADRGLERWLPIAPACYPFAHMLLVACSLAIMAATSTLPSDAPPQAPRPQYASEEALRRYAQGRLLEERGLRDLAMGEYSRALLLDDVSSGLALRMS